MKRIIYAVGTLILFVLGLVLILNQRTKPVAEDRVLIHENCTVIMVGKKASVDGSTMTTHTADCGMCDWTWRYVPAADHRPGETRKIYRISQVRTWPPEEGLKWDLIKRDFTGLEIPEVPHTFGYLHGVFGYINDQQLAIGESTIGNRSKMSNHTQTPAFNITMLSLLAMERCRTAREAITLMGSLAEKYGYGGEDGGEMLAVADPEEVWVFEIMPVGPLWTPDSGQPGAVWCAQRVPDDQVSVCPNESRIGQIDLDNPDYFMASSNVISYAVENKFWNPQGGQPFSWKKAYSPVEGSADKQPRRSRMWRFFDLVCPSAGFPASLPNMDFPFSVKPDKLLSVKDVMNLTRDKGYGTFFDPVRGLRGGPFKNPNYDDSARLISSRTVEYTTVTQGRSWLPSEIGGLVWLAWGTQDTSCFMPFYAGIKAFPSSFSQGDHWVLNRQSARWAFDYVDFHTQVAYSVAIEDIRKAQETWEDGAIKQIPEIDRQATEFYKRNKKKASDFLTAFCLNNADQVVKAWWQLGDELLVKFNHLNYYNVERRAIERKKMDFPENWKKAVKFIDIIYEDAKTF
ncbi:MAG: C69 family dipeptidase [Acidobacteriota bacterium]|nr:C69 family dipeptidase [Acidobacteriota bacterium]MDW3228509.1 C69 family dipeptidase [Acidobacteriota bacterium]